MSSFQGCGQPAFIRAQRPSLSPSLHAPCDNNRHLISSDLTLLSSPSLYPHLPQPTPTPTTTITPYRMDNLTLITAPYPRPRPNERVPSAVAGGASTWPPASPPKKNFGPRCADKRSACKIRQRRSGLSEAKPEKMSHEGNRR